MSRRDECKRLMEAIRSSRTAHACAALEADPALVDARNSHGGSPIQAAVSAGGGTVLERAIAKHLDALVHLPKAS